jgi:hypothetical protein
MIMPEPGSPQEPKSYAEMWSRGLDAMVMAGTMLGCKAHKKTPLENRVAANLSGLTDAGFDIDDLRGLLAVACDRLSGLALEGAIVYGSYENEPL